MRAAPATAPSPSVPGRAVASSIAQVAISTLVVMALYRYVVSAIGIESLGVWSLVLAVGSTLQVAVLALPAAVTRMVATRLASPDGEPVVGVVDTAVLLTALLALAVAIPALPFGAAFLAFSLPEALRAPATELLPPAIGAFVFSMVAGTYQAALYGADRIALRNLVLIGDSLLHAGLCVLLVGSYGLPGLVWARLLTNAVTLLTFLLAARSTFPGLGLVPHSWDREAFRELGSSGLRLQVISLLVVLAEPVTKGLLGRFGTVGLVGYFEMANRLVQAVRSLFVAANQVLLPRFARARLDGPARVTGLVAGAYHLTLATSLPTFALLLVGAPLIAEAWLGDSAPDFVAALMLLAAGWLPNVLAVPAYFASLGTNNLRGNLVSHAVLSVANLAGGFALGAWLGGFGVLAAWALALTASSSVLLAMAFGPGRQPYGDLVPPGLRGPALVAMAATALAFAAYGPGGLAWDGAPVPVATASGILTLATLLAMGMPLAARDARAGLLALVAGLVGREPRRP